MSIAKNIINLRESKNMSQSQLASLMGIDKNVMSRIERSERPLRDSELIKLTKIFDVSADLILGTSKTKMSETEKKYWELNEKEEKDIAKQVEEVIEGMQNDADINFYGEPMTEEDKMLLANSLEIGLRMAKEKSKKKFTPKKYRNQEEN